MSKRKSKKFKLGAHPDDWDTALYHRDVEIANLKAIIEEQKRQIEELEDLLAQYRDCDGRG